MTIHMHRWHPLHMTIHMHRWHPLHMTIHAVILSLMNNLSLYYDFTGLVALVQRSRRDNHGAQDGHLECCFQFQWEAHCDRWRGWYSHDLAAGGGDQQAADGHHDDITNHHI
jgi:hypothetical protein